MSKIAIYCDGGSRGNPGLAGWAALIQYPDNRETELGGTIDRATNNQMELHGAVEALRRIGSSSQIIVYSDSQYLIKGMREWVQGWIRNGWKTSNKKTDVKNKEYWLQLVDLAAKHKIEWVWVKGHASNGGNIRCDDLLNQLMDNHVSTNKVQRWEHHLDTLHAELS